jgi:hypothetical protein
MFNIYLRENEGKGKQWLELKIIMFLFKSDFLFHMAVSLDFDR